MKTRKTVSGVSSAIAKLMSSSEKNMPLLDSRSKSEFSIKIANSLEDRLAVFQLAYQVYLEKGYIKENGNEWLIQNYDFDSETVILMVQDKNKNLAGSVTIVFDGSSSLPAMSIYQNELNDLRIRGSRMAELSRLVINSEYRNSKEILILLFNYLAIYIHHVQLYNSFIVQVNPRHKNYYKALLNFEEIGIEKPCPHVQSAPAVLLYLATARYQSEVERCSKEQNLKAKERSLYPHFLNIHQEKLVAHYLANQKKAMTMEELIYFGYSESGFSRAVCVN